ncbi:hypothetical protein OBV_16030 [Oscillibacter valericigenes Sjm18-20]|nr:hypothetical protein OBV_16030 [Oscillibacter valericigenes Sjm18-20]
MLRRTYFDSLFPSQKEGVNNKFTGKLSALSGLSPTAPHVRPCSRIEMEQPDERRRRMSETERHGRAEKDPADGVQVIRRYEGETTAETLVVNLIRAHAERA